MTALKVYSNSNKMLEIFIYVILFTFICAIVGHIYLYLDTYIRNINNKLSFTNKMIVKHSYKIKNSNKKIEQLEAQFKKLIDKYELHGQYISGISKEINCVNHKFETLDKKLYDLSIHSHINMDKIFLLENKQNNSFEL